MCVSQKRTRAAEVERKDDHQAIDEHRQSRADFPAVFCTGFRQPEVSIPISRALLHTFVMAWLSKLAFHHVKFTHGSVSCSVLLSVVQNLINM